MLRRQLLGPGRGTTYHPQSDGPSERTIQTLEDMLRASGLQLEAVGKGIHILQSPRTTIDLMRASRWRRTRPYMAGSVNLQRAGTRFDTLNHFLESRWMFK